MVEALRGYRDRSRSGAAADAAGNVYLAGEFRGTVDFGGGPLTAAGGTNDIFVVSLEPSGAYRWSRRAGGGGVDRATGIAAAADGTLAVTGSFHGGGDFGGGPLMYAGAEDIFVASFQANGAHRGRSRSESLASIGARVCPSTERATSSEAHSTAP